MGYDGGFSKIRMKMDNQLALDNYYTSLRGSIYDIVGRDNFYKFETLAVNLRYLDNTWEQFYALTEVMNEKDIKNYENDSCKFTLISKDVLSNYIVEVEKLYNKEIAAHGEDDEENKWLKNDITSLKELLSNFNWENDTLVFSYSY